ncbi:MAG TPA: choice-of-anchor tandem repeat GloVer-containing protein [Candidatus Cybelea sp.]|nr:choice-of-anchor tandem repeat GloVer-containing protein [Candidatus Cybelea sp.]
MRLSWSAPAFSAAISILFLTGCSGGHRAFSVLPEGAAPQVLFRPSGTETVIYSFSGEPDGAVPVATLLDVDGTLYGTTSNGGRRIGSLCGQVGCGTVFSVTPAGQENVIFRFGGADGADPEAGLVEVKGTLYGTTYYGGQGNGTVFSVTRSGKERVLHRFATRPDGQSPSSNLIEVQGKLYGTTLYGGANDCGTVFSITPSGREVVLYSFKGGSYGDGAYPEAGLTELGGVLYGTTAGGGSGPGTVFKLTLSGEERVIYRFSPYRRDAKGPDSSLVNLNGKLYGTTEGGGEKFNFGAVFSVTTSGKEKMLYAFKGAPDGIFPRGGLINVGGTLYGTTWDGGVRVGETGAGTVFSIDPSGHERVTYRFGKPPDASLPAAGLTDVNGTLFGTAASGGRHPNRDCAAAYPNGCGAIFALPPSVLR